jgi:hypothetical protein
MLVSILSRIIPVHTHVLFLTFVLILSFNLPFDCPLGIFTADCLVRKFVCIHHFQNAAARFCVLSIVTGLRGMR